MGRHKKEEVSFRFWMHRDAAAEIEALIVAEMVRVASMLESRPERDSDLVGLTLRQYRERLEYAFSVMFKGKKTGGED